MNVLSNLCKFPPTEDNTCMCKTGNICDSQLYNCYCKQLVKPLVLIVCIVSKMS